VDRGGGEGRVGGGGISRDGSDDDGGGSGGESGEGGEEDDVEGRGEELDDLFGGGFGSVEEVDGLDSELVKSVDGCSRGSSSPKNESGGRGGDGRRGRKFRFRQVSDREPIRVLSSKFSRSVGSSDRDDGVDGSESSSVI